MILIPALVITALAMIWLWPDRQTIATSADPPGSRQVTGEVAAVDREPCPVEPDVADPVEPQVCGTTTVRLTSGPDDGDEITTAIPAGPGVPDIDTGDRVVLLFTPDNPSDLRYQIIDFERGRALWLVVIAFVLAIIAFGRWRGVAALAGLAITFAVLLLFIVPAILDGKPPLLVTIVGSAAITLSVLYLTHGLSVPTSMAVLGTLVSLILTGLLAVAATSLTELTGIAGEEAFLVTVAFEQVDARGLLLAGILIGALGVLDDVSVTQAATVTELASANPSSGVGQLYRAAERVGRAHIASVVNTIVLAYAGASLPILILLASSDQPLGDVLTSELLAQEIVRAVAGTLGLIAAVPITTLLAAFASRREVAAR